MAISTEVRTINPARSGISPWRAFKTDPKQWFDPEEIDKAKRYTKPLKIARAIQVTLTLVIDIAVIASEAIPNLLDDLGWNNWVLEVLVVMAVLTLVGLVQSTGFEWWRSMVYDKKWEFSTMTTGTFFSDLAKNLVIGVLLNGLLFVVLWAIIRSTDLWWIYGWAALSLLQVGLALLAPRIILPLFNKFTRIEDEDLHADIVSVAHSVGADIDKVEVSDASKRDVRKNAFVAGAGKTRRMVLFDTMLEWPRSEVRFVCAHEIGHWRRKHIMKIIPILLALLFVDFAVLKLIVENRSVLDFAGVESVAEPGAIPLFSLLFSVPGLVTGLVASYFQRVHEREADLFGLEAVPDPDSAHSAMRKLYTESLSDLAPSLWKRLNHSHPPVAERLAMIKAWGERSS